MVPALPGVGAALDDEVGTLDTDTDETAAADARADEGTDGAAEPGGRTIRDELNRSTPDDRRRTAGSSSG